MNRFFLMSRSTVVAINNFACSIKKKNYGITYNIHFLFWFLFARLISNFIWNHVTRSLLQRAAVLVEICHFLICGIFFVCFDTRTAAISFCFPEPSRFIDVFLIITGSSVGLIGTLCSIRPLVTSFLVLQVLLTVWKVRYKYSAVLDFWINSNF